MEKLKKIKLSNQIKWMILVGIILFIFAVLSVGRIVENAKIASANAKTNIDSENEIPPEEVIDQANLVETSKLSKEELKNLNEEELKKAEEKKKQEEKENKNNNTTKSKPVNPNKYYIKINYGAQVVTIYTKDKNGKYTVPVKACVCSTGAATPTSGVYRMSWKATWGKLFGNVWGQYCTQIVGDILFHSVPYKKAKKDTLVSAYYDRLGTKDSMGCIRLTTADARWIYYNCPSGTQVEFYSSSNPGPLGKPTAQKVSNAPGNLKNWDPTDPDPKNPWKNYKPGNKKPNDNTNTTTNNNQNKNETTSGSGNKNPVNNTTTPDKGNNNTIDNTQTSDKEENTNTQNNTTTETEDNDKPINNTTTPDIDENKNQENTTSTEKDKQPVNKDTV